MITTITDEQVEAAVNAYDQAKYAGRNEILEMIENTPQERMRAALTAAAQAEKPTEVMCGACGQPWTGEPCGQKDNGHPFPTCYPFEAERVEPPLPAAMTTPSLSAGESLRGQGHASPDIDYGCNADDPESAIAVILDNAQTATRVMHELDGLGFEIVCKAGPTSLSLADDGKLVQDARRYRRLQVIGCAPMGSGQLALQQVLRFTNLDEFIDRDLKACPSRGEALPLSASLSPPAQSVEGQDDLVNRLRKQAKCVYLAAEEGPADDLSDGLTKAADRIATLTQALADAQVRICEWRKVYDAADKMRDEFYDKVCNLTAELAEAEKQRAQFEACSKINALSQASWANRAEKAEAELAEARKVIEPFATKADHYSDCNGSYLGEVFVGDLRRARTWLDRNKTAGETS